MTELPLVSFTKYFKELDDSDILTFRAFSKEEQEKLLKLLLPSNNSLWLEKAYRDKAKIIFKPESVKIAHRYNKVYFYCKAGILATDLTDDVLDMVLESSNQQIYIKAQLKSKVAKSDVQAIYFVDIEEYYTATYDFDRAKELLNEHKPIELCMYAIGYKPAMPAIATKIAMLLPIFSYDDKAIHVAHFTPPRFGKTKTAKILRGLTRSYLTVMPSPAKLVYDGRSGKYGLTYWYSTLYIDEFDKIAGRRKDVFRESYEILLTGMSEGYWLRDISSKAEDYNNIVGFCFMGNIRNLSLDDYTISSSQAGYREKLANFIAQSGVDPDPFIERLTYVDLIHKGDQAYKWLNYNSNNRVEYLEPAISRAIFKLLQDEVTAKPLAKQAESELDHHFNKLKAVLDTLGIELDDATIDSLVKGDTLFADVLKEDSKPEEVKAEDYDIADDYDYTLEELIRHEIEG